MINILYVSSRIALILIGIIAAVAWIFHRNRYLSESTYHRVVSFEKITTVILTTFFVGTSFVRDKISQQSLKEIVTAITPRTLSAQDQKDITDACRPFARPNIKVVVVASSGYGMGLGIQIWKSLKDAGFTAAELRPTGNIWYEISIAGPLENSDALNAISSAIGKKLPIMGVIGILPSGSPITITVGERLVGKLPSP